MAAWSQKIFKRLSAKNKIFRELTLKVPVLLQRTALFTLTLTLVTHLLGLDRSFVACSVGSTSINRKLFSFVRDRAVLNAFIGLLKEFFRSGDQSETCARCSPQSVADNNDRHKLKRMRFPTLPEEIATTFARSPIGPHGLAVIRSFCFSVRHA